MMTKNRLLPAIIILLTGFFAIERCRADSLMTAAPGREPYTSETKGHLVVRIADHLKGRQLAFRTVFNDKTIIKKQPVKTGQRLCFPLILTDFPQGQSDIVCYLTEKGKTEPIQVTHVAVKRLAPRTNVTKIDFTRRCLLFDDQPVLPFGFYCNSDLKTSLPKEEIIHGFNMISPYRAGLAVESDKATKKTREYLDLCASIGMKVVYDLRPVAERPASEKKWAKLKAELETFGNHPAILCWIISDEPADKGLDPNMLIESYEFIKKIDPYHPVTMVFCHFVLMHKYIDGMDFVLLDYYPVPNHPVSMVGDMIEYTHKAIGSLMPLWFVPQAFGGSWAWSREPSAKEERVMTYLALLHGSSGIQYFIRRPPIENPISPLLWSSCRQLAIETAQLAPALLSNLPKPDVDCSVDTVQAQAFEHKGHYTIVTANTENKPVTFKVQLTSSTFSGKADVLFENRQINVTNGKIEEMIDAFGTRVYRFRSPAYVEEDIAIHPNNLAVNPSFEQAANAGTPDGCYVGGSDSPATIFVDPWHARHGLHSMKLNAPVKGGALRYTKSPIPVEKDTKYRISIWAKAETAGSIFKLRSGKFRLSGDENEFTLTEKWKEYVTTGTARKTSSKEAVIDLRFTGKGAAWFDLFQVVPVLK